MKRWLLSGLVLALFVAGGTIAYAQGTPMSNQRLDFSINSLNGLPLHGEARGAAGLNYTAAVSVSTEGSRSVLHRLFIDHNRHLYFGYDLEAYQVEGQQQVHLHFSPLSDISSFAGVDVANLASRNMTLPPDETVNINSSVEVPLEVAASTGGKVLRDKLTFGPPN